MTQMYPEIRIERNKKPSRYFAIPLLGFVSKLVLLIPVEFELFFLKMVQFFMSILNACNIFFRARYWKMAYELNLGIMRLETNVSYYLYGMTDVYPGFSLKTTNYDLDLAFNKNPNRVLATPLFGMLFRAVLLIPYSIYRQVLSTAAFLAVLVSWIFVLFQGRYPETTYEIARDSIRVDQAVTAYSYGMSDQYPSWWMSMNHKPLKILLLVLASLITLFSIGNRWEGQTQQRQQLKQNPNRVMNTVQSTPSSFNY